MSTRSAHIKRPAYQRCAIGGVVERENILRSDVVQKNRVWRRVSRFVPIYKPRLGAFLSIGKMLRVYPLQRSHRTYVKYVVATFENTRKIIKLRILKIIIVHTHTHMTMLRIALLMKVNNASTYGNDDSSIRAYDYGYNMYVCVFIVYRIRVTVAKWKTSIKMDERKE